MTREDEEMNGSTLVAVAMATAKELPDATHELPFGPDTDVFKVVGRIFLLASELKGEPIITLKCDPADSEELRREFSTIIPGYHVNKRLWITVASSPDITRELVQELVVDSYLLTVERLPRSRRPVLPDDLRR